MSTLTKGVSDLKLKKTTTLRHISLRHVSFFVLTHSSTGQTKKIHKLLYLVYNHVTGGSISKTCDSIKGIIKKSFEGFMI